MTVALTLNPLTGDLDASPAVSLNNIPNLSEAMHLAGWTVIGTNGWNPSTATSTHQNNSFLTENVAPVALKGIKAVFGNYTHNTALPVYWGEQPNTNYINVRAMLVRLDVQVGGQYDAIPFTFNQKDMGSCSGTALLESDPIYVNIAQGERYYIMSCPSLPLRPAAAQPTITPSNTGGSIPAGTYFGCITYVYPDGTEGISSAASASYTITGSVGSIVVTSPSNPNDGSIGYRYYNNTAGAGSASRMYLTPYGTTPFGTNLTVLTFQQGASAIYGLPQTLPGSAQIALGGGITGGTGPGSSNNGEGLSYLQELAYPGFTISPGSTSGVYGPVAVLGLTENQPVPSMAIIGDSVVSQAGDAGYANGKGAYVMRALLKQTAQFAYDPTILNPVCGFTKLSNGGETSLQFATPEYSYKRRNLANRCSHIFNNYSINDVGAPGACTEILNNLVIAKWFLADPKKTLWQDTIQPKMGSSDGFTTIANQIYYGSGGILEGNRRQYNNVLRNLGGAVTVTNENMLRGQAANVPASVNFYSGSDGTTRGYVTAQPFVQGTEIIQFNAVTQALTTNYTYLNAVTIMGVNYASGISIVGTVPANGLSVTASYTSMPGYAAMVLAYTGSSNLILPDTCANTIEVNSSNVPTPNGGFWRVDPTALLTATLNGTGTNTTQTLVDNSKTWTQDQWRGYQAIITADPVTPTSVGQLLNIGSNTATTLTSDGTFWALYAGQAAVTPSNQASYIIIDGYVFDGVHPSSRGHILRALAIDTTKIKLIP